MHSLRIRHLENLKAEIKVELDSYQDAEEKQIKIAEALDEAQQHATPTKRLKIVIYVISALLANAKNKTLSEGQLSSLLELARSSMFALQIKPGKSKLSQLYGELQFAIGLNRWRDGDHWSATWEQELGFDLAKAHIPGGPSYHQFVQGIRLARLGFVQPGLEALYASLGENPDQRRFEMTMIHIAKAHRLEGQFEKAEAVLSRLNTQSANEKLLQEVHWERLCRECIWQQNAKPLVAAVRKDKTHDAPTYMIESFLWGMTLDDRNALRKLYKMSYLARGRIFRISDYGLYFRMARMLEDSADQTYPLTTRVEFVSRVMDDLKQASSLDLELLLRACVIRSLRALECDSLAKLAELQFHDIGRRISGGTDRDPQRLLAENETSGERLSRGA